MAVSHEPAPPALVEPVPPGVRPRALLIATGTWGDVGPMLSLASALVGDGFRVDVVTHRLFVADAVRAGAGVAPVDTDPRALLGSAWGLRLMNTRNAATRVAAMIQCYSDPFPELLRAAEPLFPSADVVVFSPLGAPAGLAAHRAGIPTVFASVQPFWPSRSYASPLISTSRIPRCLNRATHAAAHAVVDWGLRRPLASLDPGDASTGRSLYRWIWDEGITSLVAASPHVSPPAEDLPDCVSLTGYWPSFESPSSAPAALSERTRVAEAVVAVTFGSMIPADPARTVAIIQRAAEKLNLSVILQAGWANFEIGSSDRVEIAGWASHDELFALADAVVHHGGAGTTAAALRSGKPSMAVPFFFDQFYWGKRIADLGVGPKPVPHRALSVRRLASAWDNLLHLPGHRKAAMSVADVLASEHGLESAVTAVRGELVAT